MPRTLLDIRDLHAYFNTKEGLVKAAVPAKPEEPVAEEAALEEASAEEAPAEEAAAPEEAVAEEAAPELPLLVAEVEQELLGLPNDYDLTAMERVRELLSTLRRGEHLDLRQRGLRDPLGVFGVGLEPGVEIATAQFGVKLRAVDRQAVEPVGLILDPI